MMQNLEEMPPNVRDRCGILFDNIQIFVSNTPSRRVDSFKQERIEQIPFGSHDAIHTGFLHTAVQVLDAHDVTIGQHWNAEDFSVRVKRKQF